MSIIIGYDHARFVVTPSGGRNPYNVDIPLTNLNGGQVESYEIRKIAHELISLDITTPTITKSQNILGWFIRWTFSYVDFIKGEDLIEFDKVIMAALAGETIQLIPRLDQDWRYFTVILDSDSFEVALRKGGIKALYNKGFQLTFVTDTLQTDLKWQIVTPADTATYPYGDEGFEEILYET